MAKFIQAFSKYCPEIDLLFVQKATAPVL